MATKLFLLSCDGSKYDQAPLQRGRRLMDRGKEILDALRALKGMGLDPASDDLNIVVLPEFFYGLFCLNKQEWKALETTLKNISRDYPNMLFVAGTGKWMEGRVGGNTALVLKNGELLLKVPKRTQAGFADTIFSGYGLENPGQALTWGWGDPENIVARKEDLPCPVVTVDGTLIGFDVCNDFRLKELKKACAATRQEPLIHIVPSAAFHVCDVDMGASSPVARNGYLINVEHMFDINADRTVEVLYKKKLAVRKRTGAGFGPPIAPTKYKAFFGKTFIVGAAAWRL